MVAVEVVAVGRSSWNSFHYYSSLVVEEVVLATQRLMAPLHHQGVVEP